MAKDGHNYYGGQSPPFDPAGCSPKWGLWATLFNICGKHGPADPLDPKSGFFPDFPRFSMGIIGKS